MTSTIRRISTMRRLMTALVALSLGVPCVGCGRLSSHPVVVEARKEVSRNPRVIELLAGPGGQVVASQKVTGRANETDGIAAMEFEASGSKGKATIVVEGRKLGREWGVTRLELRPAGGGPPVSLTADLEARTGSDTPKFDPSAAPATSSAPPPPAEIEIVLPPGTPQ
jgi:hypothetical protein